MAAHGCPCLPTARRSIRQRRNRHRMALIGRAATCAPDFSHATQHAVDAVRLASSLCEMVQRDMSSGEQADKQDESPVTVADYGAQAVVTWYLTHATGQAAVSMVAEEESQMLKSADGAAMLSRITQLVRSSLAGVPGAEGISEDDIIQCIDMGGSEGGPDGDHWVLDPIDGTRGFVGQRQYAVCLGMLRQGQPVLGVLGTPNLPRRAVTEQDAGAGVAEQAAVDGGFGCIFAAERGLGTWAGSMQQRLPAFQRCRMDAVPGFAQARFMESFESRHSNHDLTKRIAHQLGITRPPVRMDSQAKYGALSRGDAHVFMRFPPPTYREKIWDHCAGVVVVQEAGGKVSDATGAPLDFSRGRWLDLEGGIVACPAHLHTELVQATAAALNLK